MLHIDFLFYFLIAVEEQELAIIAADDPLPFAISQSIKYIFSKIARSQGKRPEQIFIPIPQIENNEKLVKVCTMFELYYRPVLTKLQ